MLVRCPQCRSEIRLADFDKDAKVIRYLCPGCNDIVPIDLELDEIASSSSSGSFRSLDRVRQVLIADDTPEFLALADQLLTAAGYKTLLAVDGLEALRIIREEHPDLVLLDLLMPRMTGFDLLREIKKDERIENTKVLVMSGVYKENILEFLQRLGAEGFLEKSQLENTLVFRVQSLLEEG